MDEQELDSFLKGRPFGTAEAREWDERTRAETKLVMTLGAALWGKTAADLERQLLAPHPEIPPGFDLADFRKLLEWTARMRFAVTKAQKFGVSPSILSSHPVSIGTHVFSSWDARCEIVRRAVEYLEGR
jgi:hypothetical protein